ncbi:uncharacterized protein LOC110944097 [Helianthus annuus]|uniref:uncharacterized protein LOC110944097 n=1 Tax=Helianthus annuus TaxID=4232 RepID=UPI000B90816B|nr:uncharacterized protein LOC110944097 [Helianthus annuus]
MGQSSSNFTIAPNSTIVHATLSFRSLNQSGFQYSTLPFGQSSGIQGDGYDDGYEEDFRGYEEEGFSYGGDGGYLGPQGGAGQQSQPIQQFQDMGRLPVGVQHIRPQGPQLQRPTPLHQVRPQITQPQFQRPIQQQPPMHQYQYQPPFAPQGPMQGQMGQPRAPLGAPQRHHREAPLSG